MTTKTGYKNLQDERYRGNTCCCAKPWRKCPCYGKVLAVIGAVILVFVVTVLIAAGIFSIFYPLHASCRINWSVEKPCDEIQSALVTQIDNWGKTAPCNGTQRCLYSVEKNTPGTLTATHETPKKHYIDDLTFEFTSTNGNSTCHIKGNSRSRIWYAVLDYGTNYCNLHNLVAGAGIDQMDGYREETNDSVCTQYSSRNCDVY